FNKNPIALIKNSQQTSSIAKSANIKVIAYPNPFNNNLIVALQLEKEDNVSVELFNVNGRSLYFKDFGKLQQGSHSLTLNPGENIFAGTYFIKINYGSKKPDYIKVIKQ
ncbi:MAG TPA: T9SS type A sorting domain-containing protein, partial [Parafilimonas sp.]